MSTGRNRKHRQSYREAILYGLIGISGVVVDFITFYIATFYFAVPAVFATIFSVSLGITNNYLLNRQFNFKVKDRPVRRFLSFYSVGLVGVTISTAMIMFGAYLGLDPIGSKLISIPFVVSLQFFVNKVWTFRINPISNENL